MGQLYAHKPWLVTDDAILLQVIYTTNNWRQMFITHLINNLVIDILN